MRAGFRPDLFPITCFKSFTLQFCRSTSNGSPLGLPVRGSTGWTLQERAKVASMTSLGLMARICSSFSMRTPLWHATEHFLPKTSPSLAKRSATLRESRVTIWPVPQRWPLVGSTGCTRTVRDPPARGSRSRFLPAASSSSSYSASSSSSSPPPRREATPPAMAVFFFFLLPMVSPSSVRASIASRLISWLRERARERRGRTTPALRMGSRRSGLETMLLMASTTRS
mmetsp:Transcript_27170/g.75934  ORF Transcript_27170/g.75934 Transcript_27170/m.75934 type:complete len:227 (+) Transcript_27170:2221-2901(+)